VPRRQSLVRVSRRKTFFDSFFFFLIIAPVDPVVPQVKTQADFEKHCTSKSGTCVITFAYVDPEFEETVTAHNENLKVVIAKLCFDLIFFLFFSST